jgi:SAM-dependent MidA family methyltransferase
MEMALYHPGLGYYNTRINAIGAEGDFYTAPMVTPAFGATIAHQLEEMWQILGSKHFTIVEFGAGNGMLCHDILHYLKGNREFYNQLHYCIIEKSPVMREKQKAHLDEKVSWHSSIKDIPAITGCILSNELLDNFSVHQVIMQDELMEVFVDYDGQLVEVLLPASQALKNYLCELNVVLPKNHRTEINLGAIEWMEEIATALKQGYLITIDYGHESNELYSERRSNGTILCYHNHTINDDPYSNIGQQDITSHVNFSALCHYGNKYGLEYCGLTNQAGFLLSLGFKEQLRKSMDHGQDLMLAARKEARISYTMLIEMGNKFKVLIQQKGIPKVSLSGLQMNAMSRVAGY